MVKLTQTVQKGGCAAKVAATELRKILEEIQFPTPHAELLVDGRYFDDAAIYKITDEIALVQTLDFFTPIVDSPEVFGKIAAANALSDVYAMGGRVKTAMVILAYPTATFENLWVQQMLQGAADIVKQAGGNIVGGHTIDDDTLKLGLSVTGLIHPQKVWSNQNAKVGDVLILTKPLGTGTHTAALKRQEVTESQIEDVLNSMMKLNNIIDLLTSEQSHHIHAATDITGFGLVGHAKNLAKASEVTLNFNVELLPVFNNTMASLEKGFLTKAHRTNKEYTVDDVDWSKVTKLVELLICDPQTSGGLLLAVEPSHAKDILESIKKDFPQARIVGQVEKTQTKCLKFEAP